MRNRLIILAAVVFSVLILWSFCVAPPVSGPRRVAKRLQCMSNLRQIGLALQSYHQRYGTFPPAYTVDDSGRRLHSWRTLILPELDSMAVLKQINLAKPWNDPVNLPMQNVDLPVYRCPSANVPRAFTTFQTLAGDDACLSPTEYRRIEDIQAPLDKTLMVIEVGDDHAVHWMDPTDHAVDYLLTPGPLQNTPHTRGINVIYLDGKARFLNADTPLEVRRAMISISQKNKPDTDN